MKEKIGQDIYNLAEKLFPICRSLTGQGVRDTLSLINEIVPLNLLEIESGTRVFDWKVPEEWNITDAYIISPTGEKIIDFKNSNLHVVGYSLPVDKTVPLEELQKNLHSLPDQPDAIPYITSYYNKTWGFCLSHNQRTNLKGGDYKVVIKSELKPGVLNYADLIIPGESEKEILISTYICHPSMANNELSGPIIATYLAKYLMESKKRKFSYRFVFCPETIGSIIYINQHLMDIKRKIIGGYVITCSGDTGNFSYLKTKSENSIIDKVTLHVLKNTETKYNTYSFIERGSDERQYSSPGIDIQMGSLMRTKYWEYPEYHTSLDNLSLFTTESLEQTLNKYIECLDILEQNQRFIATTLCEPQLGKRGLYPTISTKETASIVSNMMNILAYADGQHDLIDIAEKSNTYVMKLIPITHKLVKEGLLTLPE